MDKLTPAVMAFDALIGAENSVFDARQLIKALGKGVKGARTLGLSEAQQLIVGFAANRVTPSQMASAMMLMRVRGESTAEVAGIALGLRRLVADAWRSLEVDLDWPVYAGKRGQLPWLLLAAKALAAKGVRIVLHGDSLSLPHRCHVADCLAALNINTATTPAEASAALAADNLVYIAAESILPVVARCRALHQELGLRSAMQMAVRCVNPFDAKASLRSYFHPGLDKSYAAIAKLMAAEDTSSAASVAIFKGQQGEAELNPRVSVEMTLLTPAQRASTTALTGESSEQGTVMLQQAQLTIPTLLEATLGVSQGHDVDREQLTLAWQRLEYSAATMTVDAHNAYWTIIGTIMVANLVLGDARLKQDAEFTARLAIAQSTWAHRHGAQRNRAVSTHAEVA